jgi:hypothetical protein
VPGLRSDHCRAYDLPMLRLAGPVECGSNSRREDFQCKTNGNRDSPLFSTFARACRIEGVRHRPSHGTSRTRTSDVSVAHYGKQSVRRFMYLLFAVAQRPLELVQAPRTIDFLSGTETRRADRLIRRLFGSAHLGPGSTLVLSGPSMLQ